MILKSDFAFGHWLTHLLLLQFFLNFSCAGLCFSALCFCALCIAIPVLVTASVPFSLLVTTLPVLYFPGSTLPGEALHLEALPGEALRLDALPGEALPGEALHREALSGEALSGEALPGEALHPNTMSEAYKKFKGEVADAIKQNAKLQNEVSKQKSNGTGNLVQFPPMKPEDISEDTQCQFVHNGIRYTRVNPDSQMKYTCSICGKSMSLVSIGKHWLHGGKSCDPIKLLKFYQLKSGNHEFTELPALKVDDPPMVAVFDAHNGAAALSMSGRVVTKWHGIEGFTYPLLNSAEEKLEKLLANMNAFFGSSFSIGGLTKMLKWDVSSQDKQTVAVAADTKPSSSEDSDDSDEPSDDSDEPADDSDDAADGKGEDESESEPEDEDLNQKPAAKPTKSTSPSRKSSRLQEMDMDDTTISAIEKGFGKMCTDVLRKCVSDKVSHLNTRIGCDGRSFSSKTTLEVRLTCFKEYTVAKLRQHLDKCIRCEYSPMEKDNAPRVKVDTLPPQPDVDHWLSTDPAPITIQHWLEPWEMCSADDYDGLMEYGFLPLIATLMHWTHLAMAVTPEEEKPRMLAFLKDEENTLFTKPLFHDLDVNSKWIEKLLDDDQEPIHPAILFIYSYQVMFAPISPGKSLVASTIVALMKHYWNHDKLDSGYRDWMNKYGPRTVFPANHKFESGEWFWRKEYPNFRAVPSRGGKEKATKRAGSNSKKPKSKKQKAN